MRVRPLSRVGLLMGVLFFAFSLTPGLVPRAFVMQGVLSGASLAAGYAVGVLGRWLWQYVELPVARGRARQIITAIAAAVCVFIAGAFIWQAAEWQNSIRALMDMEPVPTAQPISVGLITLLVFGVLLAVARLFRHTFRLISRKLQRFIPAHVANVISVLGALALFWSVIDGVLFAAVLRVADSSYQQLDALIQDDLAQPEDPLVAGSAASLLDWHELGRHGRAFVSSGPTAADISAFVGEEALQPLRVYVGLNSAESQAERARLALRELQRVGAFERSVLIVVTPTGTGWVDPGAMDPLEYLHRGDIASVAVQYSYLPSGLALLVEADYGAEAARAVFDEVYGYWTKLPEDARPDLYLYGLSLGALNSDLSFDLFDIIGDPFQGALWSGPPYRSETWRSVTGRRQPGSPAWLPRFGDSSVVCFANQKRSFDTPGIPWGPFRIAFLQYASDPITFFEPEAIWRAPEWMSEPRGPDVSPQLRWFPVVTMLQLAADMAAGSAPVGYGHEYAPDHYIDAWVALTEPPGWTRENIQRLKSLFTVRPKD